MFEEEERILRADGRARGTEIGNKIYGEWFATAKKHAAESRWWWGKNIGHNKEVVTFLLRMDDETRTWVKTMSIRKENSYAIQKRFFLMRTKPKFRTLLTSTEEVAGYGSDQDGIGLAFVLPNKFFHCWNI